MAADGGSLSLAISLICKCAKAYMESAPTRPQHEYCYDRRLLAAPGPEELQEMGTAEDMLDDINDRLLGCFKPVDVVPVTHPEESAAAAIDGNGQDHEKPHHDPDVATDVGRLYRITSSVASELKAACKPLGVEYISTFDCIVGAIFRSLMRVRISQTPSLKSKYWRFVFPVDMRGRYVPANYIGNAVACASSDPLPVDHILDGDDDGISIIASSIRHAIAHLNYSTAIKYATGLDKKLLPSKRAVLMPLNFPKTGFMLTSWFGADMANMDFGIGRPAAPAHFGRAHG